MNTFNGKNNGQLPSIKSEVEAESFDFRNSYFIDFLQQWFMIPLQVFLVNHGFPRLSGLQVRRTPPGLFIIFRYFI